ncbi:hypothetical protein Trco_006763 [Trichoderma cornu-damae]|uniref:Uncharacterized protein n=1 Tax=Trichoderma cornu-damae TaxID=654480 RepID=A0A9P8QHB9_9HYPO|nr:hypothetical protein Trco_006763 [Trichoderma cornu-damae]
MPPSPFDAQGLELMCLEELLLNGGRPVAGDIAALTDKERKKAPGGYMTHCPKTKYREFFSRQADRWWDFIKWQADNRGPETGDHGCSAYSAAHMHRSV